MDEFEKFYKAYPRHIARADALKAWIQTREFRPPLSELLQAIEYGHQWRRHLESKKEFVPAWPYPATWLRGMRWEDEYDLPREALWHQSASGIEAKGRSLGIVPETFQNWQAFRAAVLRASGVELRAA